MSSRKRQENYCQKILKKVRSDVKAFVFDVDGTIKSSSEPEYLPLELVEKILCKGKFVGIITASGASAIEGLAKPIVRIISKKNYPIPVYFGVANGVGFYKLDNKGVHELWNYSLKISEVKNILRVWKTVMNKYDLRENNLLEKGLTTLRNYFKKDWGDNIPNNFLSLSKEFNGKCFAEKYKVTFVIPKGEILSQERFITMIQKGLDTIPGRNNYIIDMGDATYAHVTRNPGLLPKRFALEKIIKDLKLSRKEILTFGDMPFGNDKGLLISGRLPYTFTNKFIDNKKITIPPFLLPKSESRPIRSVYRAVDYLLEG
jgi:hypothetical protein